VPTTSVTKISRASSFSTSGGTGGFFGLRAMFLSPLQVFGRSDFLPHPAIQKPGNIKVMRGVIQHHYR
jgi:hypothetical protein